MAGDTRTVFFHGTAITPEFLTAISHMRLVQTPEQDGEIALPTREQLSDVDESLTVLEGRGGSEEETILRSSRIPALIDYAINLSTLSMLFKSAGSSFNLIPSGSHKYLSSFGGKSNDLYVGQASARSFWSPNGSGVIDAPQTLPAPESDSWGLYGPFITLDYRISQIDYRVAFDSEGHAGIPIPHFALFIAPSFPDALASYDFIFRINYALQNSHTGPLTTDFPVVFFSGVSDADHSVPSEAAVVYSNSIDIPAGSSSLRFIARVRKSGGVSSFGLSLLGFDPL